MPHHDTPRRRTATLATLITVIAVAVGIGAPVEAKKNSSNSQPTGSLSFVAGQIGADDLWAAGVTGDGVTVAIVDTGVTPVAGLSDPDKIVAVVDLSPEASVPEATFLDTYGHGTHLAGIIAGDDPATGFSGIAPGAEIVSVKVADNFGAADISQVIAGVDWVTDHADELGIDVLNLAYSSGSSLGYESDPLSYAVERAWRAGIVVVVAAGNDGRGERELATPADNPYVIAVAATETKKNGKSKVPSWATSGDGQRNPDVAAPGTSIESLRVPFSRVAVEHPEGYVDDMLFKGSGSSQAAAVVSGAVALLLDARPDLTPDQVKQLLQTGTQRVTPPVAKFAGAGLIQVDAAVAAPTPDVVQVHAPAQGDGSLEAARGDRHIEVHGAVVHGETTAHGDAWDGQNWPGARWTDGSWDGARWTDGSWMGARWTGARWTGARWTGAHWSGAHWSGTGWEGARWTGARWTGARWTDASWTGARWTGARWTEVSWTGARWTGARWTGARWTGARWTGAHWSGARWT